MADQDLSLKEAHQRLHAVPQSVAGDGRLESGAVDWEAIAQRFLESRSDRRKNTLSDTKGRLKKVLQTLATKPTPRDGATLMRNYAQQHFDRCPPGGEGRKRHLGDVSAFLTFAVEKCGAPGRWGPLAGEDRQELIGTGDGASNFTPPVKPEQLAALLDALEADNKPDLWLAVALVGCFGLRPAELAALTVVDGQLKVGSHVKRNRRTMKNPKPPRLVVALEIPGRSDGAKALKLYESGLVKLPKTLRNRIAAVESGKGEFKAVGDEFRQLLDRYPYWSSMVAGTELTPYSLRHGWAWRAHKAYDRSLPVRDAAALLGHTTSTHQRHYGSWTDEADMLQAVANLTGPIQQEQVPSPAARYQVKCPNAAGAS